MAPPPTPEPQFQSLRLRFRSTSLLRRTGDGGPGSRVPATLTDFPEVPAVTGLWGENQQMDGLSTSVSLSLPFKLNRNCFKKEERS